MDKDESKKSLISNIDDMQKIRSQLTGDLARQAGSIVQGGLTDQDTCKNLAKRLFDLYDKDSSNSLEEVECGPMIADVYKTIGRNYQVDDEDRRCMMEVLDPDKKGYATLEDFEKIMKKFLCGLE